MIGLEGIEEKIGEPAGDFLQQEPGTPKIKETGAQEPT
jgi:hypothetical protein